VATGLTVSIGTPNGFIVATLAGELDLATAPQLRDTLLTVGTQTRLVILDLADVTFLDGTCIGILIGTNRRIISSGGRLLLANVRGAAARPMRMAGVDSVIPTHFADETDPLTPWHAAGATPGDVVRALGLTLPD
jgi:anti-anti-sigma factor